MYLCLISEGNFVLRRGLKIFLRRNFCLELLPFVGIKRNLDVLGENRGNFYIKVFYIKVFLKMEFAF